jgi:hypothetical protein
MGLEVNAGVRAKYNESGRRSLTELSFQVFPTTSEVAVGLPNTGKYRKTEESWVIAVGDSEAAFALGGDSSGGRLRQQV